MPFLTTAQANAAAESTVRIATLAEFHFRSETMYLWNGAGRITLAGHEWLGLGGLGAIDSFPDLTGTDSDSVTAKLSAVDPTTLALARNSVADVQGRPAYFWFQLLDPDWQPIGAKIPAWWGIMQRIVIDRQPADETGGGARTAGLEIENVYASRGRSGAGRYTDSDQQYNHPGDLFCRYASSQASKTLIWPEY